MSVTERFSRFKCGCEPLVHVVATKRSEVFVREIVLENDIGAGTALFGGDLVIPFNEAPSAKG